MQVRLGRSKHEFASLIAACTGAGSVGRGTSRSSTLTAEPVRAAVRNDRCGWCPISSTLASMRYGFRFTVGDENLAATVHSDPLRVTESITRSRSGPFGSPRKGESAVHFPTSISGETGAGAESAVQPRTDEHRNEDLADGPVFRPHSQGAGGRSLACLRVFVARALCCLRFDAAGRARGTARTWPRS